MAWRRNKGLKKTEHLWQFLVCLLFFFSKNGLFSPSKVKKHVECAWWPNNLQCFSSLAHLWTSFISQTQLTCSLPHAAWTLTPLPSCQLRSHVHTAALVFFYFSVGFFFFIPWFPSVKPFLGSTHLSPVSIGFLKKPSWTMKVSDFWTVSPNSERQNFLFYVNMG